MVHYLPSVPLFCTISSILVILYILVHWVIHGCWLAKKKLVHVNPYQYLYGSQYPGNYRPFAPLPPVQTVPVSPWGFPQPILPPGFNQVSVASLPEVGQNPEETIEGTEVNEENNVEQDNFDIEEINEEQENVDISKIRDHTEKVGFGEDGQTIAVGKLRHSAQFNGQLIPVSFEYALRIPEDKARQGDNELDDIKSLFWYIPGQQGDECPDCVFLLGCNNGLEDCQILPVFPDTLPPPALYDLQLLQRNVIAQRSQFPVSQATPVPLFVLQH